MFKNAFLPRPCFDVRGKYEKNMECEKNNPVRGCGKMLLTLHFYIFYTFYSSSDD
jgi:hypothetical protein